MVKEPNLAKEAFQDFFGAVEAYQRGDFGGLAMTVIGFIKKASIGGSARKRSLITKTSPADVVMFSGSKDSQTSYADLFFFFFFSQIGMNDADFSVAPIRSKEGKHEAR